MNTHLRRIPLDLQAHQARPGENRVLCNFNNPTRRHHFGTTSKPPASILQFCTGPVMGSDLEQATPHGNRNRMSSIVGSQFIDQVLDMEVDRRLGNR